MPSRMSASWPARRPASPRAPHRSTMERSGRSSRFLRFSSARAPCPGRCLQDTPVTGRARPTSRRACGRGGAAAHQPPAISLNDADPIPDAPSADGGRKLMQDDAVHVTIVRVSTGDQDISTATIVGEEMLRWLRDLDGFVGSMMLSRTGTTLSLTFWETAEVAERHRSVREEFRERITAVTGVEIQEVEELEVTFAQMPALKAG